MNGPHDMGGAQCFGPVCSEPDEPLFHAGWERRALGLTVAMGAGGQWNIDLSRSARESLPPAVYLASSYYEILIRGLEQLLLERDLVTADELSGAQPPAAGRPLARLLRAADVAAVLARGAPSTRAAQSAARFVPGDRVRARNLHPPGHTRLPRYVRGHVGTIELVHGTHVFADAHARKPLPPFDDTAHWLYTVVFDARELWGAQAEANCRISVDAWEPYLESAPCVMP